MGRFRDMGILYALLRLQLSRAWLARATDVERTEIPLIRSAVGVWLANPRDSTQSSNFL